MSVPDKFRCFDHFATVPGDLFFEQNLPVEQPGILEQHVFHHAPPPVEQPDHLEQEVLHHAEPPVNLERQLPPNLLHVDILANENDENNDEDTSRYSSL